MLSGFCFLADDSLFCWVQFQEVEDSTTAMLKTNKNNATKTMRK